MDVAGVGSNSSGGSSAVRNSPSHYQSLNGTEAGSLSSVASGLSSVGGGALAGSGFEGERPAGGFAPETSPARSSFANALGLTSADSGTTVPPPDRGISGYTEGDRPVPSAPNEFGTGSGVISDVRSVASSPRSAQAQQPPSASHRERIGSAVRRTDQVLSRAAGRLRGVRNQFGGLPSDAAPHTSPPRMPIDHHE
jgi:hypothetical protein